MYGIRSAAGYWVSRFWIRAGVIVEVTADSDRAMDFTSRRECRRFVGLLEPQREYRAALLPPLQAA